MDIATLFNLYGNPSITKCSSCSGTGCEECKSFGYIAKTNNPNIIFTYSYPMFIDLQKRDSMELMKNVLTSVVTLTLIFALIISYIVNIVHG